MNAPTANPLPPYHHTPLFPLGPDKTTYRKLAADGVRAVLLTNSERNLTFYERNGFRIVAEADTPEDGPHAWAMVRDP